MADQAKTSLWDAIDKAVLFRLVTTLISVIVGAVITLVANALGVKPPEVITVPVTVQAAPALAVEDGVNVEAWPRLLGLRTRIHAEIDRRAALAASDPDRLDTAKAAEAHTFVGRLGDGHLLDLIIKYGPSIFKIVMAILGLMAVL